MIHIEILIVGNEVLMGHVQDTNSSYLCRVLRGRGGLVRHIAVVRDEIDAIAGAVKESLARRAALIFTCGGLGPTDDDLTLAGIAAATASRLELNQSAVDFIENRYRKLALEGFVAQAQMNEHRLKMARLPANALAIENPIGSAPAVIVQTGNSRIVALPGVPAELKAIVEGPLRPLLDEVMGVGGYHEREIVVACGDESELAPLLREVAAAHPKVYVKSHASRFGRDVRFRVILAASASSAEDTYRLVETATADAVRAFRKAGMESSEQPVDV